jgi:hypothetical protein
LFLFSCTKDEAILQPEEGTTELTLQFQATVNNTDLVPVTKWYTNVYGDSFTVSKFNYYISGLKFKREDGMVFSEPESYHLIKHVESKTSFVISNLPLGNYTEVEFMIGVDSLHNVSGSQSGDLDPAQQMFWDWNTGYIFYKLEGLYKTSSSIERSDFGWHIGVYSGKFATQQICKINLVNPISAKKDKPSKLYFKVKVEEVFSSPHAIGFDYFNQNNNLQTLLELSQNYKDMFVVDRVEN